MTKLDDVQFGCMISRTAKLHPEGGTWTLSHALGEVSGSLEAIEAKKTLAGKDFGELVCERRRQGGLPLPIADKVLPFRPGATSEAVDTSPPIVDVIDVSLLPDPFQLRVVLAERRVAEALAALQQAELRGVPRRTLDRLEEAYLKEVTAYQDAVVLVAVAASNAS